MLPAVPRHQGAARPEAFQAFLPERLAARAFLFRVAHALKAAAEVFETLAGALRVLAVIF